MFKSESFHFFSDEVAVSKRLLTYFYHVYILGLYIIIDSKFGTLYYHW